MSVGEPSNGSKCCDALPKSNNLMNQFKKQKSNSEFFIHLLLGETKLYEYVRIDLLAL